MLLYGTHCHCNLLWAGACKSHCCTVPLLFVMEDLSARGPDFRGSMGRSFFFFFFFFEIQLSERICSTSFFHLLVEQICSYISSFFLVSFSIFYFFLPGISTVFIIVQCGFFFFQTKGNVHGYAFLGYTFSHVFMGTWSRCVRELQNTSLEQQK